MEIAGWEIKPAGWIAIAILTVLFIYFFLLPKQNLRPQSKDLGNNSPL